MKAIIQISMADDDGIQVQWNNLYKQELKSYTIPSGPDQSKAMSKILELAKSQVRTDLLSVDMLH